MALTTEGLTDDAFLDGRLNLLQPRNGYRAATDPVLLAASVSPQPGSRVLDLGCGVGTAALCLGARLPGLSLHGVEIQNDYADLARRNGARNEIPMTVYDADIRAMPDPLRMQSFDAVIMNPPWHDEAVIASPARDRDKANRLVDVTLAIWLAAALTRLKPGGLLALIQRSAWLPEILNALATRTGDIAVLPLVSREGRDAKRVIVHARKGTAGPFRLASPLVLHTGSGHVQDGMDDLSPIARAILREGAGLEF